MELTGLTLPIVNSSSAEHLTELQSKLALDDADAIACLRVALDPTLLIENGKKYTHPSWLNGLDLLPGFTDTLLSSVGKETLQMLSGNASGNKGLNLIVYPTAISKEEIAAPVRYSTHFAVDPEYYESLQRVGIETRLTSYHRTNTLWNIIGSTVLQGRTFNIRAKFKVGKGGGLLRFMGLVEEPVHE
jgi:hypothetical protein